MVLIMLKALLMAFYKKKKIGLYILNTAGIAL